MTTTSDTLSDLMVTALTDATAAGARVYAPRDWPTSTDEMPILLVQSPTEHKDNLSGRSGAPQFNVTTIIRVVGRLTGKAQAADAGAAAVLSALAVLQRQIEVAVINSYDLGRAIQKFAYIDVKNGVSTEAELHVGELVMDFALEFYQGPEDFAPIEATPIEQMAIFADLVNVFSPTGDFDPSLEPFDAATDPPRTEGPDGRPEGAALITLPQ